MRTIVSDCGKRTSKIDNRLSSSIWYCGVGFLFAKEPRIRDEFDISVSVLHSLLYL